MQASSEHYQNTEALNQAGEGKGDQRSFLMEMSQNTAIIFLYILLRQRVVTEGRQSTAVLE